MLARDLADGRTNVLFVGRLAPNKRHDDLIRLAAYWKRYISPDVRLVLVGKPPRRRGYFDALQSLMYEQGLHAVGRRVHRATSTTATCWPATGRRTCSSP